MHQCKANSCPLPARFITNWKKDEKTGRQIPKWGVCIYHRQAEPENWVKTTERIKRYQSMILAIDALSNCDDTVLMAAPGETAQQYITRVSKQLNKLILGDVDPADARANFERIIQLLSG